MRDIPLVLLSVNSIMKITLVVLVITIGVVEEELGIVISGITILLIIGAYYLRIILPCRFFVILFNAISLLYVYISTELCVVGVLGLLSVAVDVILLFYWMTNKEEEGDG